MSKKSICKRLNIGKILLGLTILFVYYIILCIICRFIGIDSDKANHLLQAEDILSGNIFLKDWNLTGVTFLTTDLIFYEIAELFFGVYFRAIYVAGALMMLAVLSIAMYLSCIGAKDYIIFRRFLAVVLIAIPCHTLAVWLRVHSGAVFLCFCIFLLYDLIISQNGDRKIYFLFSILIFMGVFGDLLTLIEGVIPVCLLAFLDILHSDIVETGKLKKILILSVFSSIAAFVCKKIYFFIGKANPNSYIGDQLFTPVSQWPDKLQRFISDIIGLSMADFAGNKISDIWGALKGVFFLVLFIEIVFIIKILVKTIKGKNDDVLSSLLSFGCLFSFLAYFFTDMAQPRYITFIPIAGAVILIRNIEWIVSKVINQRLLLYGIGVLSCVGLVVKVHEIAKNCKPDINTGNYELIRFLEEKNLHYGYASFWNASNLTVLSGERVKIRHIQKSDKLIEMYNWFNKNFWYSEPTNFVLINNMKSDRGENDGFGISESAIIDFWGEPFATYESNGFIILVYDKCLSESLGIKKNAIDDGVVTYNEIGVMNDAEIINHDIILHREGMSIGPYDTIEPGNYEIEFVGDNISNATADVFSNYVINNNVKDAFTYTESEHTDTYIILNLTVNETIDDIEFRLFNNDSDSGVVLKEIRIK